MITGTPKGSFVPDYVLRGYKDYVTEKELVIVLALAASNSIEAASHLLNYPSVGVFKKSLAALEAKNLIQVSGKSVSLQNFYNACSVSGKAVEKRSIQQIKTRGLKKDRSVGMEIYERSSSRLMGNRHVWINTLDVLYRAVCELEEYKKLSFMSEPHVINDITSFIAYIDSYVNNNVNKPVTYGISTGLVSINNFKRWLEGGKKESYSQKREDDFRDLEREFKEEALFDGS